MSRGNLIGVILIIAIVFIGIALSDYDSETVINDKDTYDKPWRQPIGRETLDIGRVLVANNIKDCGEYYLKETHSSEYVLACSADGRNWNYYVVWSASEKILLANDEMVSKLEPPR